MRASTLIVLCAVLIPISAVRAQGPPAAGDNRSLGDIARELRHNRPSGVREPAQNSAEPEAYLQEITQDLANEDFSRLEQAADAARTQKSRFSGGGWKLFTFYVALKVPPEGEKASDAVWETHIAKLKRWQSSYPESITARVALAEAYRGFAWQARGHGFADTVYEGGWRLMEERAEMARATLIEAMHLAARCPHWYFAMQEVALLQAWPKIRARKLLAEATAFEPAYYYYYHSYANYLLPRWFGEDGEAEAYAEEVFKRVGGKEGAFLYFEIASTLNCLCTEDHLTTMSWPRIKQGYAAMVELYGTSTLKRNRLALLASKAGDKAVAQQMFTEIGDDWDGQTWVKKSTFENFKAWAMQ